MSATMQRLFDTVPSTNYLGFFSEGGVDATTVHVLSPEQVQEVKTFLKLDRKDVAKISEVAVSSVRFDSSMSKSISDRFKQIAVICELVAEVFNGNAEKTYLWFTLPNPLLGNVSPRDMIRAGQYSRLMQFVQERLQGISA